MWKTFTCQVWVIQKFLKGVPIRTSNEHIGQSSSEKFLLGVVGDQRPTTGQLAETQRPGRAQTCTGCLSHTPSFQAQGWMQKGKSNIMKTRGVDNIKDAVFSTHNRVDVHTSSQRLWQPAENRTQHRRELDRKYHSPERRHSQLIASGRRKISPPMGWHWISTTLQGWPHAQEQGINTIWTPVFFPPPSFF